jgi:hypothetical protein
MSFCFFSGHPCAANYSPSFDLVRPGREPHQVVQVVPDRVRLESIDLSALLVPGPLETLLDGVPVDDSAYVVDVVLPVVLVLEEEGVLPYVYGQQGDVVDEGHLILCLLDDQPLHPGTIAEPSPAGTWDVHQGPAHDLPEVIERTEVSLDELAQVRVAWWLLGLVGVGLGEVLEEQTVVDVASGVEPEILLGEPDHLGGVTFLVGLLEPLLGFVEAVDVVPVDALVVDPHGFTVNMGFEGIVFVRELGEGVLLALSSAGLAHSTHGRDVNEVLVDDGSGHFRLLMNGLVEDWELC